MPSNDQLLSQFSAILRELLDDDSIVLTTDTVRDDVPGWDSFSYVAFLAAIEAKLGFTFSVGDVESFENMGEIIAYVQNHQ